MIEGGSRKKLPPLKYGKGCRRSTMAKNNKRLTSVLNAMARRDQDAIQRVRRTLVFDDRVQRVNTERLKGIVEKYGWPTIDLVGAKASRHAWLIIQHADHNVRFQKKCLAMMQEIYQYNPHNISRENIAFLTDRILVNTKRKQVFGTQFYVNKKKLFTYRPIKSFKDLDHRRKEYGIPPFREYIEAMKSVGPLRIKGFRQK